MSVTKINQIQCAADQKNTGKMPCIIEKGIPMLSVFVPYSKVFTETELADFQGTLADMLVADNKNERAYVVGYYDEADGTKGSAPVTEEFKGTGRKRTIRRSRRASEFIIAGEGKQYHVSVLSLSGAHGRLREITVDDKLMAWMCVKPDVNGNRGVAGRAMSDLYVGDDMDPNGTTGEKFPIMIDYASEREHNEDFAAVQLDFNPMDLQKLMDVLLTNATPSPGTANHIIIRTDNNSLDVTGTYGADLAVTGAWLVKNKTTGATLTVSAVTKIDGTGYELTITTGTGITATVQLKAPSLLAALTAPVLGLESNVLTVAIP